MNRITEWQFAVAGVATAYFARQVGDEFQPRFDGKWQYTKDLVLGATTSAQSYTDLGTFEIAPLQMRIEFGSEAGRQTFQGLHGMVGTLSNTRGRSYTALLVSVTRIDTANEWLADAVFEAR